MKISNPEVTELEPCTVPERPAKAVVGGVGHAGAHGAGGAGPAAERKGAGMITLDICGDRWERLSDGTERSWREDETLRWKYLPDGKAAS